MNAAGWLGRSVAEPGGTPYGVLEELFVGRDSGLPEFGILALHGEVKRVVVPLGDAWPEADVLRLPLDRDRVLGAPAVRGEVAEIPPESGRRVREHFGLSDMPDRDERTVVIEPDGDRDEGDRTMTVSEEQLEVGTEARAAERVRVRRSVVTEDVNITVTVRREELVIEREPVDAPATDLTWGEGPMAEGSDIEFVLHAEEPVVHKRVVPVERVRLRRDTIVEERTISDEVRKEHVDVEQTSIPKEPDR